MIVESDIEFTEVLRKIINNRNDMQTSTSTACVDLILPLVCEKKPDVIIMNLSISGVQGLEILKRIKEITSYDPVIIITSEHEEITKRAISSIFKMALFIQKPVDCDYLLDRARDAANTQKLLSVCEENKDENNNLYLMKKITILLHDMGVPAHLKGHGYLREAICMAVENPIILSNMQKKVYSAIGDKEGKKPANIEKSIRTAIEVSLLRCNPELLKEFFGYTINSDKGKPTNSEYIAMLADRYSLWLA